MEPSQDHNDRPGTPPRPPYSPVTPVLSHTTSVPNNQLGIAEIPSSMLPPAASPSPTTQIPPPPPQTNFPSTPRPLPTFEPEPAAVPISESQNPDAIALRSAISILQLQKQQSLRDIQTLEGMKGAAAADPEGFARDLVAGKLSAKDAEGLVNLSSGEGPASNAPEASGERVGKIPTPQNVVRMPPVNWAKYQVVGEPLDKIHEEERRRPSPGEPRREDPAQRPPEHVLASPYRPLVDRLDAPSAKSSSASSRGRKS